MDVLDTLIEFFDGGNPGWLAAAIIWLYVCGIKEVLWKHIGSWRPWPHGWKRYAYLTWVLAIMVTPYLNIGMLIVCYFYYEWVWRQNCKMFKRMGLDPPGPKPK